MKETFEAFVRVLDLTFKVQILSKNVPISAAQRIHVSSMCKSVLDELGGFSVEERGLINIKVSVRILF